MVTGNLTLHPSGIVDPFVGGVEGRCYLWHFHSGCCKYAFLAVSGHWSFCSLILEVSQWPDKDIFKCLAPKIRLFFFFLPHRAASGILVPQPGIKSVPPAVKEWNFSHWTAREVPGGIFFFFFLVFWNFPVDAISDTAAPERAKTKATVCVSASSTTRSTRVHNSKFLEDEVPAAHPGTSQPLQECELLPAQLWWSWGMEGGSWFTHTACLRKMSSLFLHQALPRLL